VVLRLGDAHVIGHKVRDEAAGRVAWSAGDERIELPARADLRVEGVVIADVVAVRAAGHRAKKGDA
jgi:hypothetical protein